MFKLRPVMLLCLICILVSITLPILPLSWIAVYGEGAQPTQARQVLSLFVPVVATVIATMLPLLFRKR
jgi:hypothetical protein